MLSNTLILNITVSVTTLSSSFRTTREFFLMRKRKKLSQLHSFPVGEIQYLFSLRFSFTDSATLNCLPKFNFVDYLFSGEKCFHHHMSVWIYASGMNCCFGTCSAQQLNFIQFVPLKLVLIIKWQFGEALCHFMFLEAFHGNWAVKTSENSLENVGLRGPNFPAL